MRVKKNPKYLYGLWMGKEQKTPLIVICSVCGAVPKIEMNDFIFHSVIHNGAKLAVASVARARPLFLPQPEII